MAIGGGACTAYRMRLEGGELSIKATTTLSSLCAGVEDAVSQILNGGSAMVAGSDATAVRLAVRERILSRSEALQISRETLDRAEQERASLAEQEAQRSIA